jgi:hypothetical protein
MSGGVEGQRGSLPVSRQNPGFNEYLKAVADSNHGALALGEGLQQVFEGGLQFQSPQAACAEGITVGETAGYCQHGIIAPLFAVVSQAAERNDFGVTTGQADGFGQIAIAVGAGGV